MNLIFGAHAVIEALRAGKEIEKIIMKKELSGETLREILKTARDRNIPYQFVPVERMNRLTSKNHQGVIAYISSIEYQPIEQVLPGLFEQGIDPFILILDHVTDVRNFGSIVRTAECAGVHAIIIPDKGAAQINADAIKLLPGHCLISQFAALATLTQAVQLCAESGLKIIAASEKGSDIYSKTDYAGPVAIVMGAEDEGVSPEILRKADKIVKIPLLGKVESLNVAVAAGLILYEVLRNRQINMN